MGHQLLVVSHQVTTVPRQRLVHVVKGNVHNGYHGNDVRRAAADENGGCYSDLEKWSEGYEGDDTRAKLFIQYIYTSHHPLPPIRPSNEITEGKKRKKDERKEARQKEIKQERKEERKEGTRKKKE